MRRMLPLVLLVVVLLPTEAKATEDFVTFFRRFCSDAQFRMSRVQFPLTVRLGSFCEEDLTVEKWSRRRFAAEFTVPVTLEEREKQFLSQQITQPSSGEVEVFQYHEEADDYLLRYYFRLRNGRWFLVKLSDRSC